MANIWNTTVVSIASVVELELAVLAASVDGQMVEQIQFKALDGEDEGRVLRASQGYALELCADHVRIYTAGAGARYATVSFGELAYAGDYRQTHAETAAEQLEAEQALIRSRKTTVSMRKVAA